MLIVPLQPWNKSVPGRQIRGWLVTALLAASAYLAGAGLVAPICYFNARASIGRGASFIPLAYAPQAEMFYICILLLGSAWIAVWLVRAIRLRRHHLPIAHAAVPLCVFVWAAWRAALTAYACNPI
jgi:hypothetical protein